MNTTQPNTCTDLTARRVTVMGLGHFGGGAAVTRWLADRGAQITLTDLHSESELRNSLVPLRDLVAAGRVRLRLGGHERHDFENADLIVANPAVPRPWENEFLCLAAEAGVPVTTEIALLVEQLNRDRIIGITGTAGKSTTAAMIHQVLSRLGHRAHLGGNIGGSLLNEIDDIAADDWIVLELSSAMLYWLGEKETERAGPSSARLIAPRHSVWGRTSSHGWSPATAVITNIAPNHLDWHGSYEHYERSKLNITRFQQPGEPFILGDQLPDDDSLQIRLRIPGRHNITNARAAIAAVCAAINVDPIAAALALDDFAGLPHRLQLVADVDGRRFYNDSKSTTPEATVRAIESLPDHSRIHLIVGGYDKGADLSPIASLAPRLVGLYTIGTTSPSIANCSPRDACVFVCDSIDRAVAAAFARMRRRDVLLLSPGCASWDQFTNFEHRGNAFIELVNEQLNRRGAEAQTV